jgi:hypothetical protein
MNASDGAAGAREMSRPAGRCIGSRAHCPKLVAQLDAAKVRVMAVCAKANG